MAVMRVKQRPRPRRRPQRLDEMEVNAGVVVPPIFGVAQAIPSFLRAAAPAPSRIVRAGMTAAQLKRLFDLSRGEGTWFQGVLGAFPIDDYSRARAAARARRIHRASHWRR